MFDLRIAVTPANARSSASAIIAHWESVGTAARSTVKVAAADTALLPLLVCRALAGSVLRKLPAAGTVTSTVTVQVPGMVELPAGIERPAGKVTVMALVVTAPLPVQVVLAFGVGAITTPLGKVSMSAALKVATLAFGLASVMVRVEPPPGLVVVGLKALVSVGGLAGTASTLVESIDAEPFSAKTLPVVLALVVKVMLVFAIMCPRKMLDVPIAAEVPTCQNTLVPRPPLLI